MGARPIIWQGGRVQGSTVRGFQGCFYLVKESMGINTQVRRSFRPSAEFEESLARIRTPITAEDDAFAEIYWKASEELRKAWANRQAEIEDWTRKR